MITSKNAAAVDIDVYRIYCSLSQLPGNLLYISMYLYSFVSYDKQLHVKVQTSGVENVGAQFSKSCIISCFSQDNISILKLL